MPRPLDPKHMRQLARLGAKARLEELRREADTILDAFPGLTVSASVEVPKVVPRRRRKLRRKPAPQVATPRAALAPTPATAGKRTMSNTQPRANSKPMRRLRGRGVKARATSKSTPT